MKPFQGRIQAQLNGLTLADSRQALVMYETRLDPVYYFPPQDVRTDLLISSKHHTHCPFRGNASYWSARVGQEVEEDLVWSYEEPYAEAKQIEKYMAFYAHRVDLIAEADGPAPAIPDRGMPIRDNPLLDWLLYEAWQAGSLQDLASSLAEYMLASGFPISRLRLLVRTLHPLLFSTAYGWQQDNQEIKVVRVSYDVLTSDAFLQSPLVGIFEGAGGVRRRLDIPNPTLDYPILEDLHGQGCTDYVAMPMSFSDGQINAVTLASSQPGGFSTAHLGYLHEALPLLSRLVEVHATRQNAANLLETYLGRHTGKRVLDGLIKRGDGERIYAVLWFCDLRDSTPLADSMPQQDFLLLLNQFFECMAGAILEHEGEVLRFIGDAVLAIFPISSAAPESQGRCEITQRACLQALKAARNADERLTALNRERAEQNLMPLGWGIGLHLGEVTYGNIGTPSRLEFTVIGAAANEAARIESLCKTLGHPLLISQAFAVHCPSGLESLGVHQLRGVGDAQEIYTLSSTPSHEIIHGPTERVDPLR